MASTSTTTYANCHPTSFLSIRSSISRNPTPQRVAAAARLRPPSAGRRECLFLTATTVLTAINLPSADAKDIGFFGIRKSIEKAEEQAEELVKEGFESVEKGIDTLETEIESAEKGVVAAEKGIENAAENVNFGGLAQAGVVAGAELFGVLVATSIVNGILSPQKS